MFRTEIGWCDCTHNHWIGCAKISRGCRFCYAESQERRWHPANDGRRAASVWGRNAARRLTAEQNRRKPRSWDRQAAAQGWPLRVFSASLADVFEDHPMLPPWRADLFRLIEETPHLRWMLLTKRIELVAAMTAEVWGTDWPSNVWLGTSVEGQREADDRLPVLLDIEGPAERFVSAEPLLEPVVIDGHLNTARYPLSLLIAGGESGTQARPMSLDAARSMRDQATDADVPFFFKQWGTWCPPSQLPQDTFTTWEAGHGTSAHDVTLPWRFSKKASGRLLDGVLHDGVVRSWAAELTAAGHELVTA